MSRPRILNGSRILVYFNNRPYGRCASIAFSTITPHKPARGVDVPYICENMPTTYAVQGSMTVYRMIGDGGAEGSGIQAPQYLQSREKYGTLVLTERQTDTTVLKIDQVSIDSQAWTFASKTLVMGNITFTGIVFTNEVQTS